MNIFAYRLPRRARFLCACSVSLYKGIHPDCFVIAPFDPAEGGCLSIPFERRLTLDQLDGELDRCYAGGGDTAPALPVASTTRDEHRAQAEAIIAEIRSGRLEKCVLARVITGEARISASRMLTELSDAYPDAFVFMFHTPEAGTWIGATPEVLVERYFDRWRTMALAGTRPAGDLSLWSKKDIHEHEVVRRYIQSVLERNADDVKAKGMKLLVAGPVEHMMSRFSFRVPAGGSIGDIAAALSPTPALAGLPQREAISLIKTTENFTRGYYGGYCGAYSENGDLRLFVNLRSMRWEPSRYCLYVGGGIMGDSDPDAEWEETRRKAQTLLDVMETCRR